MSFATQFINSDTARAALKTGVTNCRARGLTSFLMKLFTLETERLRLRPLTLDDAEQLHQLFDTDPEVWQFDPGYARSFDERVKCVERRIQQYQTYGFGCFGIEHISNLKLIGQSGLSPHQFENEDGSITSPKLLVSAVVVPVFGE